MTTLTRDKSTPIGLTAELTQESSVSEVATEMNDEETSPEASEKSED
jgi:hypothetical protein